MRRSVVVKLAIIGSGYVGLVSGACMADFGHQVVCIDNDKSKVASIEAGRMPFFEPGLDQLVAANRQAGRLVLATSLEPHIGDADVVFLAVGTPSRRGDGHADLTHVYAAARDVGCAAHKPLVVVTKSTVPVGTGDNIERILKEACPDLDIAVASNPEFLREGSAIEDFRRPDRIVIGAEDASTHEIMAEVYRPLYLNRSPIQSTSRRTAELIKYAANAFLAMKITFINEIAELCEQVDANVQDVARGIGLDNRIGSKFLNPGPGYGGSCFPKDTLALVKTAQDSGAPMRIVETVVAVNDQRKRGMARKVIAACDGSVRDKTIAVLGLTFKPNTDDMRDAPSLALISALEDAGARVKAFDPQGMENARAMLSKVEFCSNAYDCARGAAALVIVTEWNEFRALDLQNVKDLLTAPVMVDLRNIYKPEEMSRLGFRYASIGRPFGSAGSA